MYCPKGTAEAGLSARRHSADLGSDRGKIIITLVEALHGSSNVQNPGGTFRVVCLVIITPHDIQLTTAQ